MAFDFKFPDVGEGIHEGVIVAWLVKVGDAVTLDQPFVKVETDKAVVDLPAPKPGVVLALHFEKGATIHVGDVLITFGEAGEKLAAQPQGTPVPAGTQHPVAVAGTPAAPTPAASAALRTGTHARHAPHAGLRPQARRGPGRLRAHGKERPHHRRGRGPGRRGVPPRLRPAPPQPRPRPCPGPGGDRPRPAPWRGWPSRTCARSSPRPCP